eukprot:CAMPEP_0170514786 /NCGR_PEP_ID=MMETSP0209-20121228/1339_1 /TAXON_ID=665100 ORGANISM="Litonotus pictus, Strain P1" /NCGR_SAMPLE_ID=MMETSP0209 /ASSEMBLY_ACC=CAM_ASM_000301 /LENGTH=104 /DNA_ID=CAMNT_0010799011 /DNA_START=521 /DNA_END=835 /DNA_ORIENTATION=+
MYEEYLSDFRAGNSHKWNYESTLVFNAYGPSKSFLNSYMVDLAEKVKSKGVMVNAFNPGWVKTEMGGEGALLTVEEGVKTAEFLDGFKEFNTGKWYEDNKIIDF